MIRLIHCLFVKLFFWPLLVTTVVIFGFAVVTAINGEVFKAAAIMVGLLFFMELFNPNKV